ncbi:divergent polysaccharide deacetylase family protein [Litorivita sp. NS0012-18]|uniref:divergent polysaccharide deacteylase family protein n=1 Tax=Litorivita sp. NS0012-18 TaxID=3127655 RepID=UPI003341A536
MRGFLFGASLGAAVSVVGAGVLSVAVGPVGEGTQTALGSAGASQSAPDQAAADQSSPAAPNGPVASKPSQEPANEVATAETAPSQAPQAEGKPEDKPADTGAQTGAPLGADANLPAVDPAPQSGEAPSIAAPQAQASAPVDTAPAALPDVGAPVQSNLEAPQGAPAAQGAADVETETPVYPSPQAQAPDAPQSEAELSISTNPAQPPAPDAAAPRSAFPASDLSQITAPALGQGTEDQGTEDQGTEDQGADVTGSGPDVAKDTAKDGASDTAEDAAQESAKDDATGAPSGADVSVMTEAPQMGGQAPEQPENGNSAEAASAQTAPDAGASAQAQPDQSGGLDRANAGRDEAQRDAPTAAPPANAPAPAPRAKPQTAALPRTDDPAPDAQGSGVAPDEEAASAPRNDAAQAPADTQIAAARPKIGTPAGTLGGGSSLIAQRSAGNGAASAKSALPSIGARGDAATDAAQTDDDARVDADAPPLRRFAQPFDNPEGKPLMSIILIDDGKSGLGQQALGTFPYPITIAIDTEWAQAAEAARNYRAAGYEVVAMANLPQNFSAADTEVAMSALLRRVPQATAVIEGTGSGLQGNKDMSLQLASILSATGHGLVLTSKGLNAGAKLAANEGVPTATLLRDIDGEGQDARVIRRFLDHAAFQARQNGEGVIMLGRLRAETISALHIWGQAERAARVALAPASAVLQQAAQ